MRLGVAASYATVLSDIRRRHALEAPSEGISPTHDTIGKVCETTTLLELMRQYLVLYLAEISCFLTEISFVNGISVI